MKREDKELLMRDLSGRLPYGVKASTKIGGNIRISFIGEDTIIGEDGDSYDVSFITPYLFPLSSMTNEQSVEYTKTLIINDLFCLETPETYDWFDKNHFDYRSLIEKGLAIDCTNLDIY